MAELTQQEREKIYLEEKMKREAAGISSGALVLLNMLAIAGLAGIFYLSLKLEEKKPSAEDIRKSYDGLSPEDLEEYARSTSSVN
ncbi:MAG: hypothetical protein A2219_04970 [Elusimicrobia bacterium RIFOXYA2_FULL_50_26]|nr:MAG: hypothetical protein A2219_04970 [Elusimicrobia bacterium RIFOXYA2_FULL_50_26]OGS22879.1 MAG: hypothetical protein A2314_02420 [Elusimicrobia bacterium RIFOXYB2_FULL_50_12]